LVSNKNLNDIQGLHSGAGDVCRHHLFGRLLEYSVEGDRSRLRRCGGRLRLESDGTRAETRFRLSPKRTGPFQSAVASVQSTAGSRGVRISVSKAGNTTFRGSVRVLAIHSIRQFPLHFPSRVPSGFKLTLPTHQSTRHSVQKGWTLHEYPALFLAHNAVYSVHSTSSL
jgi:hypothetical protein